MQITLSFLLLFIIQNNLIHYGRSAPLEHVSGGFRRNFRPLSHQRVFCLCLFCLPFWLHTGIFWAICGYVLHAVCTHWNADQLDDVWFSWTSCLGLETVEWPLGCICSCCHGQCLVQKPTGCLEPGTLCVYSWPASPWVCFGWCEIVFHVCCPLFSVDVVICHICRFIVIFFQGGISIHLIL